MLFNQKLEKQPRSEYSKYPRIIAGPRDKEDALSNEIAETIKNEGDPLIHNIRIWDRLADRWISTFPIDQLRLAEILRKCNRVMDYGCGDGRVTAELLGLGFDHIAGADASKKMCEIAANRMPHVEISWITNPRMSIPVSVKYDALLLVGVLSSVVPAIERKELILRLYRLLRRGGVLIVADFGRSVEPYYVARYTQPLIEDYTFKTAEGLLIHHFDMKELLDLLSQWFDVQLTITVSATTSHGNKLPGHIITAHRR